MIYLMSPYSGTREEMKHRYGQAASSCAALFREGINVFSPIVHWHEVANMYNLPTDAKAYESYNADMMAICSAGLLLEIPGWKTSKGVAQELEWYKKRRDKPVFSLRSDLSEKEWFILKDKLKQV